MKYGLEFRIATCIGLIPTLSSCINSFLLKLFSSTALFKNSLVAMSSTHFARQWNTFLPLLPTAERSIIFLYKVECSSPLGP